MSNVWKTFDKATMRDGRAQCRVCNSWIATAGGTTNLRNHLKRKHPECVMDYSQPPSTSSQNEIDPFVLIKTEDNPQMVFDIAFAKFIAKEFLPLHIADSLSFREMIGTANPLIEVPGRQSVEALLLAKRESLQTAIMDELRRAEKVNLSTDIWTSDSNRAYLLLTSHFVTDEWILQSRLLSICELSDSDIVENLETKLCHMLGEWGLDKSKVITVATVNTRGIDVALEHMDIRKHDCFAHTIHTAVGKSLQILDDLFDKCRRLVSQLKLLEVQSSGNLEEKSGVIGFLLVQDQATDWNSRLQMVEGLVGQRAAITDVLQDGKISSDLELTSADWEVLEELGNILQPFKLATEALCSNSYVPASLVLPCVCQLMEETRGYVCSGILVNLCKALAENLEKLCDVHRLLHSPIAFATVLDPRFKSLAFLSDEDKNALIGHFRRLHPIQTFTVSSEDEDDFAKVSICSDDDGAASRKRFKENALHELVSKLCQSSKTTADMDEITQYLSHPVVNNPDPLVWWSGNATRYPSLCNWAKQYLSIPATSVPSERLLSTSGNVVVAKDSGFSSEMIKLLTFLNMNEW